MSSRCMLSSANIFHNSRSASSRCLYARRSGGREPDGGFIKSLKVLTSEGNEEVLYVTSAALRLAQ